MTGWSAAAAGLALTVLTLAAYVWWTGRQPGTGPERPDPGGRRS